MNRPFIAIAYNPKSGSFRLDRLEQLASAYDAAGYDSLLIDSYAPDFLAQVSGAAQLCVSGGDGTLRDVIARLNGAETIPPISMFPGGTINLVAREAGYPADIPAFVARTTGPHAGELRVHHHGVAGNASMLVCLSAGPESWAVHLVSEDLKKRIGRFAYAAAFAKLLWRWPRVAIQVRTDEAEYRCEAVFVLKGRYFAGPWMIDPAADMMNDHFNLLLLPVARRRDYLRLILATIIHPALGSKKWLRLPSRTVDIEGPERVPVQVDGDIACHLPVQVRMAENNIIFV
ncbi:diacylglycerol/lipid kinase family protein [Sphingorhabdus arenilitoris]|uniref:Diacylglycerol/lipid kinase family protein n=1 Tax=Sphingorhabdus arenilitoris TaxID=1490041 RepID=A0ABV8RFF5_9SPHN